MEFAQDNHFPDQEDRILTKPWTTPIQAKLKIKPANEPSISIIKAYLDTYEYETHSDKVLAQMLIKLINDGKAIVTVPINHLELSHFGNLMTTNKEAEAFQYETNCLNNWQRTLIPLSEGKPARFMKS